MKIAAARKGRPVIRRNDGLQSRVRRDENDRDQAENVVNKMPGPDRLFSRGRVSCRVESKNPANKIIYPRFSVFSR